MGFITVKSKSATLDTEKEMVVIKFKNEKAKKSFIKEIKSMPDGYLYYCEAPSKTGKAKMEKEFAKLFPDYKKVGETITAL
jgi:tryptophan synthase alpha subunit